MWRKILNEKVERSQKTDRDEFMAIADPNSAELNYRWPNGNTTTTGFGPYGSLNGLILIDVLTEKVGDALF
jgi:hypothetical protein